MLTERELKVEARLIAMQSLLTSTAALLYIVTGYTDEQIKEVERGILATRSLEAFGGDPATSDLLSAEIEDASRELLSQLSEKVRDVRSRLSR
ncbi:MAG: hypothetical protein JSS66_18960 [Armatimonadetes bacterium]|nr:hypothetical protein [Armatimonadota bacterium]